MKQDNDSEIEEQENLLLLKLLQKKTQENLTSFDLGAKYIQAMTFYTLFQELLKDNELFFLYRERLKVKQSFLHKNQLKNVFHE